MPNKTDSNITGLRYAEEQTIGVLPVTPVWKGLEPNSYGDFGAQYTQVARNPIKPNRQRSKGVLTDMEASVNFQMDFVGKQLDGLLSCFMFADWRYKTNMSVSAVGAAYNVTSSTGITANDWIVGENFTNAANNGGKLVTAVTGTSVTAAGLVTEASPPASASITKVGRRGASGDLTLTVSGSIVTLGSTALNLTTLGLVPGEWVFIGGDDAANKFATAANNGYYRVKTIAANAIVFDQYPTGVATDNGSGKLIDIFFGHVLKNEDDYTLIKRKTLQFERMYDTTMYEYVLGCVANTIEFNIQTADKVTTELGFIGLTAQDAIAAKTGTRPSIIAESAYNSSTDFMKLALFDELGNNISSYITDLKLKIDNKAEALKAAGYLGGFDITVGDFMVNGSLTAYFVNNKAVEAIRNNYSVGISFLLGSRIDKTAWCFDIPNLTLGDGRKQVEKDKAITLPLTMEAAEHSLYKHTMLLVNFKYLPALAYN